MVQPAVPSPIRPKRSMSTESNESAKDGASAINPKPNWIIPPREANRSEKNHDNYYKAYLDSIIRQTSTDSDDAESHTEVPIELAATKLLILNGSTTKRF